MKVLEIIEIKVWIDGSGWSYSQCISNKQIEISPEALQPGTKMDWDWWELNEPTDGEDTEITISYYRPDYDPMFDDDEPLASWTIWESELRKEEDND